MTGVHRPAFVCQYRFTSIMITTISEILKSRISHLESGISNQVSPAEVPTLRELDGLEIRDYRCPMPDFTISEKLRLRLPLKEISLFSPMKPTRLILALTLAASAFAARLLSADTPYGAPLPLAEAKRILVAAQAEATKNQWNVCIAIVDSGGHLVAFERMDSTQYGSVDVAQEKARSAAAFRRPTKVFQDAVAGGGEGLRMLKLPGALPIEGGLPLVVGGKIVGAIGVSGVTSAQDGQIAAAGVAGLK